MSDKLKELAGHVIRTHTDFEWLKRRGGFLPSVERTRGSLATGHAYQSQFSVGQATRKMSLTLEFFPVAEETGLVQGAFDSTIRGIKPAVPVFLKPTTPGNLLVILVFGAGNTTQFPDSLTFLDDPVIPPDGAYAPYPFASQGGWTVVATSTTDYSGQNVGGPCGISYHPHGGVCTAGLIVGVAWRKVFPGEVTTHPVSAAVKSFGFAQDSITSAWLYEFGTRRTPIPLAGVNDDNHAMPFIPNVFHAALPPVAGTSLSIYAWATSAGHVASPTPVAGNAIQGTMLHQSNQDNNDIIGATQQTNWIQMVKSAGTTEVSIETNHGNTYAGLNWCGTTIGLPKGLDIPEIPYPENKIFISGGLLVADTDILYASGVRIFIDGQDISQWIFGAPSGIIDQDNWHFDDIDISNWVKSPGRHSLVVTADEGAADVDSRFEII